MSGSFLCEFCDRAYEGESGLRRHLLSRHDALYRRGLSPRVLVGEELQQRLDALYEQHQSAAARRERARRSAIVQVAAMMSQPPVGVGRGRGRGRGNAYPFAAPPAAVTVGSGGAATAAIGGVGLASVAVGSPPRWTTEMAIQTAVATVDRATGDQLTVTETAVQTAGRSTQNRGTQVDQHDGIGPLPPPGPHSIRRILEVVAGNRGLSAGQVTHAMLIGGQSILPAERRLIEGYALAAIAARRELVNLLLQQLEALSQATDPALRATALNGIYRQLLEENERFIREADLDITE